jgi:ribosomal protein S18 acetylase RimI-like enzyme
MKLEKPIFLISTRSDDLVKALKESPKIITIWIRSGKYKDKMPLIRSAITYEAKSNIDAKAYTKRFISVFSIPGTHTKISVLKGISNKEIFQLLTYTRKDKLIRSQTHDFDRFKSKKTFWTWEKRGKSIYSLINKNGKLLGIIWFSKKMFKKYRFTLAIRTYPPIRGKGIALKFLRIVYENFKNNHRHSGLWLKTTGNNLPDINLYKSFGFRKASKTKNETLMVFKK